MRARGKESIGAQRAFYLVEGMNSSMSNRNRVGEFTFLVALALNSTASAGGPAVSTTILVDPPAPAQALARYFANAAKGDPWSEPNSVFMEIDASLPAIAEQGQLRAIRDWADPKTPHYRVIHVEGDATVKQQVIGRYLTAEKQAAAIPASSVAVTPANYKFRFVGSSGEPPVYAFHIKPKKKRPGLIEGELWIDSVTGLAVHEAGYVVKKPSIFIRHLKVTRDVSLRDSAPYLRTTHIDVDVRIAGRAELTIIEIPCDHPSSTVLATEGEQRDTGDTKP